MSDDKNYDDVVIEASDKLFADESEQPETDVKKSEETTESAEPTTDKSEVVEEKEPEYVFTDEDGSQFTIDEVNTWRKDSDNKKSWQQSNTQSAQEVSEQRKAIQPMIDLANKLEGKKDIVHTIKDYLKEEIGEDAEQLFEDSLSLDPEKVANPYTEENERLQAELNDLKNQQNMEKMVKDFKTEFKVTDRQAEKVLDYAVDHYEETGRALSLEEAHKILNSEKLEKELEKAKRTVPNPPTKVNKTQGAKDIAEKRDPNKRMSYDDVDVSGFNLFG
tara:strand:+ start:388 stop:1215 length:828 start_codon:yes stop_codon:yes gene_type:complete